MGAVSAARTDLVNPCTFNKASMNCMSWCLQFKANKVIYRRYAGLFFSMCVDVTDNELAYLESVHLSVEILDHYFSNVCELDLVFNFHKVAIATADMPQTVAFMLCKSGASTVYTRLHIACVRRCICCWMSSLWEASCRRQAKR